MAFSIFKDFNQNRGVENVAWNIMAEEMQARFASGTNVLKPAQPRDEKEVQVSAKRYPPLTDDTVLLVHTYRILKEKKDEDENEQKIIETPAFKESVLIADALVHNNELDYINSRRLQWRVWWHGVDNYQKIINEFVDQNAGHAKLAAIKEELSQGENESCAAYVKRVWPSYHRAKAGSDSNTIYVRHVETDSERIKRYAYLIFSSLAMGALIGLGTLTGGVVPIVLGAIFALAHLLLTIGLAWQPFAQWLHDHAVIKAIIQAVALLGALTLIVTGVVATAGLAIPVVSPMWIVVVSQLKGAMVLSMGTVALFPSLFTRKRVNEISLTEDKLQTTEENATVPDNRSALAKFFKSFTLAPEGKFEKDMQSARRLSAGS